MTAGRTSGLLRSGEGEGLFREGTGLGDLVAGLEEGVERKPRGSSFSWGLEEAGEGVLVFGGLWAVWESTTSVSVVRELSMEADTSMMVSGVRRELEGEVEEDALNW